MSKWSIAALPIVIAAAAAHAVEPFGVQAYGSFKQMSHTGKTDGVIKLSALGGEKNTYGVGALAGMRGEILLWDGKLLVSRGHSPKGETSTATATDEAVLFVGGKAYAWQEISVPADMTQKQFETFVIESARKSGIDADRAFPFAVRGDTLDVAWHVVTGTPATGSHGSGTHQLGHAQSRMFRETATTGTLLGFHTGAALEGVASHPGEHFHVHYADADFSVSGHVDEYRVPKGATLMLPRQ